MTRGSKVAILIFFFPREGVKRQQVRFSQTLYGREIRTWGGKYRYHQEGVLEKMPHRRLGHGGVLVLWAKDAEKVQELVGQYGGLCEVRIIEPVEKDLQTLRTVGD